MIVTAGGGAPAAVSITREEVMTNKDKAFSALTRRSVLKGGAVIAGGAIGGLSGFPYINRLAVRAQDAPLKFW
jgi:multiple sugar transport system substrate-binding protein